MPLVLRLFSRPLFAILVLILYLSSCTTPSIVTTQEQQAGDASFNAHEYKNAIEHYNNMLEASAKLGIYRNLSMEADVHRKMADSYSMLGLYKQAEENLKSALGLDSTDANKLGIIEDHRLLGKLYLYSGDNASGVEYLEKSLFLSDGMDESAKNVNRLSIAGIYLTLGQAYALQGKYNETKKNISSAAKLYEKAGNKEGEMECLLVLAATNIDRGELEKAKTKVVKALNIAEETGKSSSRHNNKLAEINSGLGYYQDALRYQEIALGQSKEYAILPQELWFTIRMGDIYREMGDSKQAGNYYKKASALADSMAGESSAIEASMGLRTGDYLKSRDYYIAGGSTEGAGISSLRLGEALAQEDNNQKALETFTQAEIYFSKSGSLTGQANARINIARQYYILGNIKESEKYADSLTLLEQFPEITWQAWYIKALNAQSEMDYESAKLAYLKSIEIIEKIRGRMTIEEFRSVYMNNKREVYDNYIKLLLLLDEPTKAYYYSERAKARSFYEMIAGRNIEFRESNNEELIKNEQEKREEIQKAYMQIQKVFQPTSSNEMREINLQNLRQSLIDSQEEYQELLRKLKLSEPAYAEIVDAAPVKLEDIQSGIKNNRALLSYWISDDKLNIWLITNTDILQASSDIAADKLNELVEDARWFIKANSQEKIQSYITQLYSILIQPLEKELKEFSELVIIPNGSLHFLPFHALKKQGGEYLIEQYDILYSPSASIYKLCEEMEVPMGNNFFGAALSDVSIAENPGLPGTKTELDKIISLFNKNTSVYGKEIKEEDIKSEIGNYDYIHLATHGIYNYKQALYSHLLFPGSDTEDGRLTVHEVMGLKIKSRLVTLSACETGLGHIDKGDEIIGLSRSFIYAGSPSVIVSLWSVADYPTALLMTKFYHYLDSYPMYKALAMAQREVMKEYPGPLYWAPFVLIGAGSY